MESPQLFNKLKSLYSKELRINVLGTVLGGAILTFLLFFLGEVVFPAPNLTGEWRVAATTKQTTYRSFMNVTGYSEVELLQKGCEIIGSGDITSEKNPNGDTLTFQPEKRVKIDVTGYLEHHYLAPCKVYINIVQYGQLAKSTNTFILTLIDDNHLTGNFFTTVANGKGIVTFERKK